MGRWLQEESFASNALSLSNDAVRTCHDKVADHSFFSSVLASACRTFNFPRPHGFQHSIVSAFNQYKVSVARNPVRTPTPWLLYRNSFAAAVSFQMIKTSLSIL